MAVYPFIQVDAFTDRPLGGNACAVFFETDDLDAARMLAIAREMNLSESAFVRRSQAADFAVRYFTPAEEIPLAGHPTLATAYALVDSGRFALSGERSMLRLELQVGPLPVELIAREGRVERMIMTQKQPEFGPQIPPEEALPAFGLVAADILPGAPVQIVSTGTPQLMIPLRNLEALRHAQVNVPRYIELRRKWQFFSPHLFTLQGVTPSGDTFARHFGVPPDSPEDPFTGSASGGMGAYLWRHRLIERPNFVAEQGHWMERPGIGTVEVIGPPDAIETVKVGGAAVTVLRGELTL